MSRTIAMCPAFALPTSRSARRDGSDQVWKIKRQKKGRIVSKLFFYWLERRVTRSKRVKNGVFSFTRLVAYVYVGAAFFDLHGDLQVDRSSQSIKQIWFLPIILTYSKVEAYVSSLNSKDLCEIWEFEINRYYVVCGICLQNIYLRNIFAYVYKFIIKLCRLTMQRWFEHRFA